jgi:cation diffusion facilitator CzcD-associated flavoprotein CzcO
VGQPAAASGGRSSPICCGGWPLRSVAISSPSCIRGKWVATTLVYATGLDARAYVRPLEVIGEGGLTLEEAWADGSVAYRSVAVPGFPNLFMLMGPHSPGSSSSATVRWGYRLQQLVPR